MGDEVRRTQHGNNNAYCQDNDISWFDWRALDTHADILRFARLLLLMRARGDRARGAIIASLNEVLERARIQWHGVKLRCPDWSDDSHSLAGTATTLDGRFLVHFMMNGYWEPLTFELPPAPMSHQGWRRAFDTFLEPPHDILDIFDAAEAAPPFTDMTYQVQPRSLALLFALRASETDQGGLLPG
jgi:glycogen operon protein